MMAAKNEPKDELEDFLGPEDIASAKDVAEAARSPKSRARSAAAARIAGAPYDWIAETMGYTTPASARIAVEAVLGDMYEATDYASARNLARSRLEKMFRKAQSKAFNDLSTVKVNGEDVVVPNEDQLRWFMAALGVQDRIINLDGLNAPQRVELRVPEAAEFDALVRKVVLGQGGKLELEGDPFDDDIIDAEIVEEPDAGAA